MDVQLLQVFFLTTTQTIMAKIMMRTNHVVPSLSVLDLVKNVSTLTLLLDILVTLMSDSMTAHTTKILIICLMELSDVSKREMCGLIRQWPKSN